MSHDANRTNSEQPKRIGPGANKRLIEVWLKDNPSNPLAVDRGDFLFDEGGVTVTMRMSDGVKVRRHFPWSSVTEWRELAT